MPSRHVPLAKVLLVLSSAMAVSTLPGAPAHADVIGTLKVGPASGMDETLFSGSVADARCPRGTADSYFSIDGPGLPRDQAILAPGNTTGSGAQSFQGASIANIKSTSSGSFATSGTYTIRFNCVRSPDGAVTSTYERSLTYNTAGAGSFTWQAAPSFSPPTALRPSARPAPSGPSASSSPVESPRPGDRVASTSPSTAAVAGGAERSDGEGIGGFVARSQTGLYAALGLGLLASGIALSAARRRRRVAL